MKDSRELEEPVAGASGHDEPVDLRRYLLILWRRRTVIAVLTLIVVAISVAANWIKPPLYLASARLEIGGAPSAVAERMARYRGIIEDGSLAAEVASKSQLGAAPHLLTAVDLRSGTTSRIGTPANVLFIDVRLPEPELTTVAARESAQRLVDIVNQQDASTFAATQQALRTQLAEADRILIETRQALSDFRLKNHDLISKMQLQETNGWRNELADTLAEIPAERARLRAAQKHLAQTKPVMLVKRGASDELLIQGQPTTPQVAEAARIPAAIEIVNPAYTFAEQQVALSQTKLAGLEAKRDYLSEARRREPGSAQEVAAFTNTHATLLSDVIRSQRSRDGLSALAVQTSRERAQAPPLLFFNADSVISARLVGPSSSSVVLRGVAVGLMLAIAGVWFHYFASLPDRQRT